MVWKYGSRFGLFLIAVSVPVFLPIQDASTKNTSLVANQNARTHDVSPGPQAPSDIPVKFARNLNSTRLYKQQLSKQKQRLQILLHKQKIQERKQEIARKKLRGEQKAFQKKTVK
ncbi:MAG: hypothetical protein ISR48_03275 [Alphaproteobacteria bacterium]|nr:hypothetical protein [Alphaproteobacteria bacterium]